MAFSYENFLTDMCEICFSSIQPTDGNVYAAYKSSESQISGVMDRHIPVRQAYHRKKKFPCMNRVLKKAI